MRSSDGYVWIHGRKVWHAVGNKINLPRRDAVNVTQKRCRVLTHHNQTVGEPANLIEHRALMGIRFAQYRVKCCDEWHLQLAQEHENVAPRYAAKNTVFVLEAHEIVSIEVEKLGGTLVRSQILLGNLHANALRILVV